MESKFKVFQGGYYQALGEIYAVVTGQKSESKITTEWYYIIRNGKRIKAKGFHISADSIFESIDVFWNSETIRNLKDNIFYTELFPASKKNEYQVILDRNIELSEIDRHFLFTLYSENPGFIDYIIKNTICDDFVDYAKLLKTIVIDRSEVAPYEEEI